MHDIFIQNNNYNFFLVVQRKNVLKYNVHFDLLRCLT